MKLYLLNTPEGVFIVRAMSGVRALALAGQDEADITSLPECGEEELMFAFDAPNDLAPPPAREVEVTHLGDKERRYRNLDTGSIRVAPMRKT